MSGVKDLLGDKLFGTEPYKLVRRKDPDTSHEAAYRLDSAGLESKVYDIIRSFGATGRISDQVRAQLPGLPYSSVTARYQALLEKDYIVDTGERRPGNSGRKMRVMRAIR